MVDNQEKLALTADVAALRAQLKPEEEIASLAKNSEAEYNSLLSDINIKYEEAVATAAGAKDRALEAAQNAIDQATSVYESRITELSNNKLRMEQEAENYYQQLRDRDADIIARQNELESQISEKLKRLSEIEAEEARIRAEEEAKIRAQAEEARRKAEEASRTTFNRPKIKF